MTESIAVHKCPECDAEIKIPPDAVQGEIVTCAECGQNYELGSPSAEFRFKLAKAEQVSEDWGQ